MAPLSGPSARHRCAARVAPLQAAATQQSARRASQTLAIPLLQATSMPTPDDWKDACFRDLRPKALSDAKRQSLSLENVRDPAGHTSVATTEGYMRGGELKE